jgi:hypothetical protein
MWLEVYLVIKKLEIFEIFYSSLKWPPKKSTASTLEIHN